MLLNFSDTINRHLSNITAVLTSQISELVKKFDSLKDRLVDVEERIANAIIPAMHEIAKIVDDQCHQKPSNTTQQQQRHQGTLCSEIIQFFIPEYERSSPNTLKNKRQHRHKQQYRQKELTQIFSNPNNGLQ